MTTATNDQPEPWLKDSGEAESSRLTLFCLPYAGGGASAYRLWPAGLPSDVALCRIQPPGREERLRETPFVRLSPLVKTLAGVLSDRVRRPFAVFGHSLGALVAFELVRELRRSLGVTPSHLFVASCPAPHMVVTTNPLHVLPDEEFAEELQRIGGTPEVVLSEPRILSIFLPLLRADFEVFETYQHQPESPLDCPITVLGGRADPSVSQDHLLGWSEHTTDSFQRLMFPGDHFFLNERRDDVLEIVGRTLSMYLEAIDSAT
jgi:medium-chain acyl-[acyl-carrier-protein] hydrolase